MTGAPGLLGLPILGAGCMEMELVGPTCGRAVACTLEIWVACALEIMVACTLGI